MREDMLNRLAAITAEEREILEGRSTIDRAFYMDSGADTVTANRLLRGQKAITMRPHTRFIHFPEHTHDYIELIYMYCGSTTHIINGKEVVISDGEALILNPYARQEILPARQEDIAVNFIILPQFLNKSLEMLGEEETPLRRFIMDCIAGIDNPDGYLHFKVRDILPIRNLFENLIYSFLYDIPNKRKTNEVTLGLLLLQFINNSDKLTYENNDKSVVLQVLQYIEENYRDGSLTLAANALHYDLAWLSREIKRKTGKTYTELLQEKRLSQAAYLLLNTDGNIAEIAAAVGYDNMSYFYRIFERHFRMSPREYRNNNRAR